MHVLCPRRAWVAHSSFIDGWWPLPADLRAAAWLVRRHLRLHSYDWVLYGDDPFLAELAAQGAPHLPATDTTVLGSKIGQARAFARHGIPTPPTVIARRGDEVRLRYPVLVKLDGSSGGTGTRVARAPSELDLPPFDVVVQEKLEGRIWSADALFDRGRLRACATSIMARVHPAPFGASTVRQYRPAPALEDVVERAGAAVGAHGFANATAVEQGGFQLFELDLRVNASFRYAAVAGVDFARAAADLLAGRAIVRPRVRSVEVALYPQEILRCIEEVDLAGLVVFRRALPPSDPRLERVYRRAMRYSLVRLTTKAMKARVFARR